MSNGGLLKENREEESWEVEEGRDMIGNGGSSEGILVNERFGASKE